MTEPRTPEGAPIAVIGAGIMGAGIAQVFTQAGHPVRLQARRPETLEAALARVRSKFTARAPRTLRAIPS